MENYCMQASTESIPNPSLPKILTSGRKLRDIARDALVALHRSNDPPVYFIRGGQIVRFRTDEQNRPMLELLTEAMMIGRLARVANFTKLDSKGSEINCDPPSKVAKDILAIGSWPFPPIEGIVESPILRSDGSILLDQGYDAGSRLYFFPSPNFKMADLPNYPSEGDIQKAKSLISDILLDFPFIEQADMTNMIAALITPIVRPIIEGCVPLALIDAPQAGSGKTLLCQLVGIIGTGHYPTMVPYSTEASEMRKKISSALLSGASVIVLDNLTTELSSDMLASALTSPVWGDRLLGRNEQLILPQRAMWLANGNNLKVGGDLPRRCFPIRLDAKVSQPWMRTGFYHTDLLAWATENRPELIWAILVLFRGWVLAGCPLFSGQAIGGFYDWCRKIGGLLEYAGFGGFLSNMNSVYSIADEEGLQWEVFLSALNQIYCGKWFTTHMVANALSNDDLSVDALPDEIGSPYRYDGGIDPRVSQKLGYELKKRIGTRYGEAQYYVETEPDAHRKVNKYRVVCGNAGTCGVSGTDIQNEVLNQNLEVNAPATPAAPAVFENRCVSCSSDNWHSYPDGSGRFCGTCHPPAKRSE